MDAPELKPCPFCGGGTTNIEGKGMTWRGVGGYSDPNYYQLSHHGNLSETDDFPRCNIQFRARSAEDCAYFWNRRAALQDKPHEPDRP